MLNVLDNKRPDDTVNPVEQFLRSDRMPHIWCPGCGIGTTVNSFAHALIESKIDLQSLALVSGIGCTGRVAGYVKLDSFHTTHGRAIPFATGLKLANPKLNVVVYSGDGDLSAIGGNHLIHAARRNIDLKVICVNNLIYAMTGGQTAPTTPGHATTSTNPYGTFEPAFNLPHLVEAAGAVYVARWTTFHVRQLARSISEAFQKKGFSFIEVISPCPTLYQRRNKMGDGLDTMKFYKEKSKVKNGAPTSEVGLTLNGEIAVGKFVDRDRPDYQTMMRAQYVETLGERYISKNQKRSAYAANRDSRGRLRRPGSHSLGHSIGQGGIDLRKRLCHHDTELRSGSARWSMQRPTRAVRLAGAVSVCDAARHHGRHVAGGLQPLRARTEAGGHSDHRGGPGAGLQYQYAIKKVYSIPATRIAEELGKRMVLNSVMVGFFTAVTKLLTPEAVRKAVADSVPPSFRELNLQAFEKGLEYGNKELAAAPPRQGLEELAYSSE